MSTTLPGSVSSKGKDGLRPAKFIQLSGLKELGRLTCALEKTPLPTIFFKWRKKPYLATQVDTLQRRPIYYYVASESAEFLGYKISGNGEEVSLTDFSANSAFVYSPIISLDDIPRSYERGLKEGREKRGEMYASIRVRDLNSLAKIAAYKVLYDEPPLPVFRFLHKKDDVLGVFTRLDDLEEASIFFYLKIGSKPKAPFIRYSSSKGSGASLTNNLGDHAYIFIKVIELLGSHPLVAL